MADPRTIARQAVDALGGRANITDVENCITRLRVTVRSLDRVDESGLRAIDGVLGVVMDDTVQIVLGPGLVNEVADAMAEEAEYGLDLPNAPTQPGCTSGASRSGATASGATRHRSRPSCGGSPTSSSR